MVLPLHHPLRVAEEWAVVDNLSGGRVGLCVASGWHANDFALRPEAYGHHRELMYEHLDTVRRLWSGEAVTATSGSGEDVELRIYPRPVQSMPPLSVGDHPLRPGPTGRSVPSATRAIRRSATSVTRIPSGGVLMPVSTGTSARVKPSRRASSRTSSSR